MGDRYVKWEAAEVIGRLEAAGFEHVNKNGTGEMIFERAVGVHESRIPDYQPFKIMIYTSIGNGCSSVRACGTDAGRVVLRDIKNDRVLWKGKKVLRTKSFIENLLQRARDAYKRVCPETCPRCGAPMVLREPRAGTEATWSAFWGCTGYPQCRGTRKIGAK